MYGCKSAGEISALANHELKSWSVGGEVWLFNRFTKASNDSAGQSTGCGVISLVVRCVDKSRTPVGIATTVKGLCNSYGRKVLYAFEATRVKALEIAACRFLCWS